MSSTDRLPPPEYEPEDATPSIVVATGATLAAILALGIGVAALVHIREARHSAGRPPTADALFQHGPDDRTSVEESWDAVDRTVQGHREGYAWIDRRAGIVRIPIERAMDLILGEQGPPAAKPDTARAGR